MTLDREDIEAIADAVAKRLSVKETTTDDMAYLVTLPMEEQKRILKERRAQA